MNREQVIGKAGTIKLGMQKRAVRIKDLAAQIGLASAGLSPDVKPERLQTMQMEFSNAAEKQSTDGIMLAVLRWVLGCTEGIDPSNLELDK
tara:strand:+ start:2829 stop:3101 length:273 start_codon:yes stop_codon:yes gene_type:complete